jgi:hypothetical protein
VWDLLATGPRARAQRTLIERAIAPIWEANHVWLIIIVTILFAAFPPAFSVIFTALHVPLMLVLVGIVLRGSTFVFRQYGAPDDVTAHRLGRVFAVTSTITPVFLGVCLGAITGERIRVEKGVPVTGFFEPWAGLFPFTVGLLALCAFAFLAATYLIHEAGDDADLREDFRRRALASGVATALCAVLGAVLARGADVVRLVAARGPRRGRDLRGRDFQPHAPPPARCTRARRRVGDARRPRLGPGPPPLPRRARRDDRRRRRPAEHRAPRALAGARGRAARLPVALRDAARLQAPS